MSPEAEFVVPTAEDIQERYLTGVSTDSVEGYLNDLGERLDRFYRDLVEPLKEERWSPQEQLEACYEGTWSEILAVDLVASLIVQLGPHHLKLKEAFVRHLADEMRHAKIYQEAAHSLAGEEVTDQPPPDNHQELFEQLHQLSDDPLEVSFIGSYCLERILIHLMEARLAQPDLHPELRRVFETIAIDDNFHVAVGRMSGRVVAARGETKRKEILQRLPAILSWVASTVPDRKV